MSQFFTLPQLTASFTSARPQTEVLLVAGGRAPAAAWLQKASCARDIWCADSGIDACRRAAAVPVHLVGDGDSASSEGWQWGMQLGIPVDRFSPKKDLTDTQLALQKISETYQSATVILTGVWGGRFDHAFSNIFSLAGARQLGLYGCAADEKEILLLLTGPDAVAIETATRPTAISLLPLSGECQGVSIHGVYWPLEEVALTKSLPYAISNELTPTGKNFQVSVQAGCLGVYLHWD